MKIGGIVHCNISGTNKLLYNMFPSPISLTDKPLHIDIRIIFL